MGMTFEFIYALSLNAVIQDTILYSQQQLAAVGEVAFSPIWTAMELYHDSGLKKDSSRKLGNEAESASKPYQALLRLIGKGTKFMSGSSSPSCEPAMSLLTTVKDTDGDLRTDNRELSNGVVSS
ncbi:hypothetical protein RRG08_011693 [Elysia crispata]|uniref:Uncharacterized protein n=1 Tax=Elysia crispata TaxID=231223 RepID=A0AAE1B2Q5_9GAST|nr:hypothetical protein RRG08_011693 [Elysia crispata]